MASPVVVNVHGLGGSELQLELQASETIQILREKISTSWSLDAYAFRLLAESTILEDDIQIRSVAPGDGVPFEVQLVKFDPMPDLGQFDPTDHVGVQVKHLDGKIPRTVLQKTSDQVDSNNVFIRQLIQEPCFVEFRVVRSGDEMSFGVTYEAAKVNDISGFSNFYEKSTWVFSKRRQMPVFQFAGSRLNPNESGFAEGDTVAIYADPQERLVTFYRNGEEVGSNLPDHPLPAADGRALRMYVMVDRKHDEVEILRFGPGDPYTLAAQPAAIPSDPVRVRVLGLGGNELELEMDSAETINILRQKISESWSVDAYAFRLLAGSAILQDDMELQSLAPGDGEPCEVQLVKYDPLPELGHFDPARHNGIEVRTLPGGIPRTVLTKTDNWPDSNNVFLRHLIQEPCFVEFKVVRTSDEMSFGVTYEAARVEPKSGFGNLNEKSTWLYSKRQSMPIFLFAGRHQNPPGAGFGQGATIAVFADPQERCVVFYKNGEKVGSNLPDSPLPAPEGRALRMYAMVDATHDEVEVLRFGPGEPYS